MACCKYCCGCLDCDPGMQGKCCCGGASGTCCEVGEYCCDGECVSEPCGDCPGSCVFESDGSGQWVFISGDSCDVCSGLIAPCCCPEPSDPPAAAGETVTTQCDRGPCGGQCIFQWEYDGAGPAYWNYLSGDCPPAGSGGGCECQPPDSAPNILPEPGTGPTDVGYCEENPLP